MREHQPMDEALAAINRQQDQIEALSYRAAKAEALYQRTVAVLMAIHHLLPPGPVKGDDGNTYILDLNNPLWMDAYQQLGERIRAIPAEIEKAKAEPCPHQGPARCGVCKGSGKVYDTTRGPDGGEETCPSCFGEGDAP